MPIASRGMSASFDIGRMPRRESAARTSQSRLAI
jgi:hypothetical protein